MKSNNLFFKISVLISLVCMIIITSCKKDESPSSVNYRISELKEYRNEDLTRFSTFEYDGERVSLQTSCYVPDDDSSRTQFDYPDNIHTVMTTFNKSEGNWSEIAKTELTLQDNEIIQKIEYFFTEGTWLEGSKITYQYENGHLKEWIEYYMQDSSQAWEPSTKISFEYDGDKLIRDIQYDYTSDWETIGKEEFEHDGDKLSHWIIYEYQDGAYLEQFMLEFHYDGNKLMEIEISDYQDGTWSSYRDYMSYTYDSLGNVSSQTYILYEGLSFKSEYYYEEGDGNVRQLLYNPGGLYDYFPWPTKSVPGSMVGIPVKEMPFAPLRPCGIKEMPHYPNNPGRDHWLGGLR